MYDLANDKIIEDNQQVFALLSRYLNNAPDLIKKEEIDEIVKQGVSCEYAFSLLLASAYGMDIINNTVDKDRFNQYFTKMINKLDVKKYDSNSYFKNIKIPVVKTGSSELTYEKYKPYEGFVCDDIVTTREGRFIPQIGFFEIEFRFPALLENNRIWMTITPNEIETMREDIDAAFGNVLTFGLGLGYFAYMASEKDCVESVNIVEINQEVIHLFVEHILPQCPNAHKIKVIQADAFEYAQSSLSRGNYDYVFTDLWHDVSDGLDMYLQMKKYESKSPNTIFKYWIEKSILCYL